LFSLRLTNTEYFAAAVGFLHDGRGHRFGALVDNDRRRRSDRDRSGFDRLCFELFDLGGLGLNRLGCNDGGLDRLCLDGLCIVRFGSTDRDSSGIASTGCASAALASAGSRVPPTPSVSDCLVGCSAAVLATGSVTTAVVTALVASPATEVDRHRSVFVALAVLTLVIDDVVAGSAATTGAGAGRQRRRRHHLGLGTNSRACANSSGATSGRVTMIRAPILVVFQSSWAKLSVSRTQPCDAG